jgi:hypothetical protein
MEKDAGFFSSIAWVIDNTEAIGVPNRGEIVRFDFALFVRVVGCHALRTSKFALVDARSSVWKFVFSEKRYTKTLKNAKLRRDKPLILQEFANWGWYGSCLLCRMVRESSRVGLKGFRLVAPLQCSTTLWFAS